ncbi:CoA transferase [Stagnimonas aquatica]|uniref:CoA transferase n=1 Tax=Stagnimonas aquatica TaxID=2689987 RepID=A0A3N0V4U0_9GAMM|nr:CoA transferase [Stagnimonas aquatica]ROH87817.1 CoA transferase [Stagnimonas aquatica]
MSDLSHLQVLELSGHLAAAACGQLLQGFGARLLRVPVSAPGFELDADEDAFYHQGKAKAVLAYESAEFAQRLAQADVLLDGAGHGVLAAAGWSAERLRALNPGLVLVQITPHGQAGPLAAAPASDLTLYAASGLMRSTGSGEREPLNARPRIVELTGGMNAFFAVMAALLRRTREGGGDCIDLALRESAMENIEVALAEYLANGKIARRNGDQHAMVPWRTYPCADGEIAALGGPIRHWLKAAAQFEAPALLSEKLADMGGRIAHRAETEALLKPWLATRSREQLFHWGQQQGLAWAPLRSLPEALADPQHAARGYFHERVGADGQSRRLPSAPFRPERCAWSERSRGAESWSTRSTTEPLPPRGGGVGERGDFDSQAAPFAGLRVLDFSHDWAGPHAARLYADYGAEVIKIEYPRRLDGMRGGYPDKINAHPRFWQLHRGKRSLTLDLKLEAHRAVLDALVRDADLLIENSRPGVMARKGYGPERLRALNPRLVTVALSAFGASGPYASYAGYGGTLEAASGLQSLTAYAEGGPAYRVREMDVMNGLMGACAAALGLYCRTLDGQGQWIDVSECETTAWFVAPLFAEAARHGQPPPLGNHHPQWAPQGCYPAAGEDQWLTLSVRSEAEWQALARRLGGAGLASDPRYASAERRRQNHAELDARIADWSRGRNAGESAALLNADGIAAAPVASVADLASDPQLQARGWFAELDAGLRLPGLPFRLARGGGAVRSRGPDLGEANAHYYRAAGQEAALPSLNPAQLGTAYARD